MHALRPARPAVFGLITSAVFAGIVLWAVPGYLRERRRALANFAARPGFTPPLTLLKPLHGAEPGLEPHLETFFTQDYPGVRNSFLRARCRTMQASKPRAALPRVYPHIPVKFLSTGGAARLHQRQSRLDGTDGSAAAHEILVISDSDVRVTPDYLRAVALPFADRNVGGMCCLYRGVAAEGGFWARLEAVGMSVEMSCGVLAARSMEGMQFTLGPTMAFRRETIRRMGGFKSRPTTAPTTSCSATRPTSWARQWCSAITPSTTWFSTRASWLRSSIRFAG